MKTLFAVIFCVLLVASVGIYLGYPDTRTEVPVIYWVTDKNPARVQQVATFEGWLIKNGHVTEDGKPKVELRLDMANRDQTKQTIQSVSGVGGDLMDMGGAQSMRLFEAMDVIVDVTDDAKAMNFSPSQTYAAVEPEITVDGRQYMFPCNVAVQVYWVNVDAFERVGMAPPPDRWTFEEFERMGKAYCDKANTPDTPPSDRHFFASDIREQIMHRALGLSVFNQTLTACDLDDERYERVLELKQKWTYQDNILPTPDDRDAFSTQQGYGGSNLALFGTGNYAMVPGGRWLLIKFRDFDNLGELRVVEPPHGGFPNTTIGTRAAVLYRGSPNRELAKLFLAYLASEDYNMQIVRDADALPPNPKFATHEEFLRPPDHPNEWQAHGRIAEMAHDIAIAGVHSPFVLANVVNREIQFFREDFVAGSITAKQAAERTAEKIDKLIVDEVRRKPELRAEYERRVELQKEIDRYLAEGRRLPRAWVSNPFYLRYYEQMGMLEEDPEASLAGPPSAASQ